MTDFQKAAPAEIITGLELETDGEICSTCNKPRVKDCEGKYIVDRTDQTRNKLVTTCPRVIEGLRVEKERRIMEAADIPIRYQLPFIKERAPEAYAAGAVWLKAEKEPWLYIYGDPGTGKSHLGCQLLAKKITEGKTGAFIEGKLLVHLAKTGGHEWDGYFKKLSAVDVLDFDDLSAVRDTPFAIDMAGLLINTRYNAMKQTIFTSNQSPTESVECVDLRWVLIMDRIIGETGDKYLLKMAGKSKRIGGIDD